MERTGGLGAWLTSRWVVRGGQIVIGVVFAWAGLAKLGDLGAFAAQIHNFRILPVALENIVAITLPWIELVAALALILGIRARPAAFLATGLLAVFTVAIVLAVARSLDIECGCFGTADASHVGLVKIVENLGLLAAGAVGCLRSR